MLYTDSKQRLQRIFYSFAVLEHDTTPSEYFEKIKQSVVMTSSVVCSECENLKTEVQNLKMILMNRDRAFKEVSSYKYSYDNPKLFV